MQETIEGRLQCVINSRKDGELSRQERKYSQGAGWSILVVDEVTRTRAGLRLEQKQRQMQKSSVKSGQVWPMLLTRRGR